MRRLFVAVVLAGLAHSATVGTVATVATVATVGTIANVAAQTRVPPSLFGRVFQQNRSALVRVRADTAGPPRWTTGFVAGTEGEVIFSIGGVQLTPKMFVRSSGKEYEAELLGFDRNLSIGVIRSRETWSSRPMQGAAAEAQRIRSGDWLVVIKHDRRGRATPHAGVVEGWSLPSKKKPTGVKVVRLQAPAEAGSPVLSSQGELVGMALDAGRRRTRVLPVDAFLPFVRSVVLGRATRN